MISFGVLAAANPPSHSVMWQLGRRGLEIEGTSGIAAERWGHGTFIARSFATSRTRRSWTWRRTSWRCDRRGRPSSPERGRWSRNRPREVQFARFLRANATRFCHRRGVHAHNNNLQVRSDAS